MGKELIGLARNGKGKVLVHPAHKGPATALSDVPCLPPSQVESPVFQDFPRLPAPLGSFLYTAPLFRNLPLPDRLSALPLLRALLEFDADDAAYAHYDTMTARDLFLQAGITQRLYKVWLGAAMSRL